MTECPNENWRAAARTFSADDLIRLHADSLKYGKVNREWKLYGHVLRQEMRRRGIALGT